MDILPIPEARIRISLEATEAWNNCLTGGAVEDVFQIHSDMSNNLLKQAEMIKEYDVLYRGDTKNGIEKRDRGPDAINIRHPRLAGKLRPFGEEEDGDEDEEEDGDEDSKHSTREEDDDEDSKHSASEKESQNSEESKELEEESQTKRHSGDDSGDDADDTDVEAEEENAEEEEDKAQTGEEESEDEDSADDSEEDSSDDDVIEVVEQPSPARKKARSENSKTAEANAKPRRLPLPTTEKRKLRSQGKASLDGLPDGMK
jgi:hypothetical protein